MTKMRNIGDGNTVSLHSIILAFKPVPQFEREVRASGKGRFAEFWVKEGARCS